MESAAVTGSSHSGLRADGSEPVLAHIRLNCVSWCITAYLLTLHFGFHVILHYGAIFLCAFTASFPFVLSLFPRFPFWAFLKIFIKSPLRGRLLKAFWKSFHYVVKSLWKRLCTPHVQFLQVELPQIGKCFFLNVSTLHFSSSDQQVNNAPLLQVILGVWGVKTLHLLAISIF